MTNVVAQSSELIGFQMVDVYRLDQICPVRSGGVGRVLHHRFEIVSFYIFEIEVQV